MYEISTLPAAEFPKRLLEIPQPPKQLTYRGTLPPSNLPLLTIIGSRKYSTYGTQVVEHLIGGLRGYRVGIVSGLALGIDSLAHEAALKNNLYTIAIPGSGLDDSVLYPARHRPLARRILEADGGLLSEFDPDFTATKWSFIQRNRLMAGIAHATLVIEATEQSGTLATARMCVDYNRDLCVVPGNIFSKNSAGPHLFLKLGATPVTSATDIIDLLSLTTTTTQTPTASPPLSELESKLLTLLTIPTDSDTIIRKSMRPTSEVSVALMQLELKGYITSTQGIYRAII